MESNIGSLVSYVYQYLPELRTIVNYGERHDHF